MKSTQIRQALCSRSSGRHNFSKIVFSCQEWQDLTFCQEIQNYWKFWFKIKTKFRFTTGNAVQIKPTLDLLQITLLLRGLLARSLRQRRGDELSRRRGCSQQSRGERLLSFDRFFKSVKNVLKLMISLPFWVFLNKKQKILS